MRTSLPNYLSASRIALSIAILFSYSNSIATLYWLSIAMLALALLTDILDGKLARRTGSTSEMGYVLDGLGDRAVYISLILIFVARHDLNLFLAWLLAFREVLIYALRLLKRNWYRENPKVRSFSRWHAAGIRVWFLSYMVPDGYMVSMGTTMPWQTVVEALQLSLAVLTIAVSYYGLFRAITLGTLEEADVVLHASTMAKEGQA